MRRHMSQTDLTWAQQTVEKPLLSSESGVVFFCFVFLRVSLLSSPRWKAQQRSGLQSLWPWQMVPSVPVVALTVHWPQTHIWSEQHSSSLVQGYVCGDTHVCKQVCKAHMVCCCIHGQCIFVHSFTRSCILFSIRSKMHCVVLLILPYCTVLTIQLALL